MDEPEVPLPFLPGEVGNGEFLPRPPTRRDRAVVRQCLAEADRAMSASGLLPAQWQPRGPITRRGMLAWLARPETRWAPW